MSGRFGKMLVLPVLAMASVALVACFTASASASEVHVYSHTFGTGLSLTPQSGIAVNDETGEAYIADTGHSRIAKFTSAGSADGTLATATAPTFLAIDNSSGPSKGDVYVVEGKFTVTKLDPAGALVTGWGTGGHLTSTDEILGIAMNPSGDLWVLSENPGHAGPIFPYEGATTTGMEFDQAGTSVRSWTVPFENGNPTVAGNLALGTAVDSADNLFLYWGARDGSANFGLRRIDSAGTVTGFLSQNPLGDGGVAVESSTDDIYQGNLEGKPNVARLLPDLNHLERFGGEYEGTVPTPGSSIDELKSISSLAVSAAGAVYAVDPTQGKVAVYEFEEVEPPSVTIEPVTSVTKTSAHVVGHVNPNAATGSRSSHDVAWHFECMSACPGYEGKIEVEFDGSERTVEATIGGLQPGTKYSVRLEAENRGGMVKAGPVLFTTAPAAPTVIDDAASEVLRGEATLNAAINPNGAETTYHFEYLTRAAFEAEGFGGAQTQRTSEADPLPPSAVVHHVSERISGLQPATEYIFRAVAVNSIDTATGAPVSLRSQLGPSPLETNCPNQALRTGPGARLPDCRAYELASPVDKQGGAVEPFESWLQASPDGSAATWATSGTATGIPSPGEAAHQESAFYLSSAGAAGWSSQRLLPPEAYGELGHFGGLTEDGRYALLETSVSRTGAEPGLYLLDTASQAVTVVVPPQTGQQVENRGFVFDGASADDRLFFFETTLQLTANATPDKNNLYLWNRETGEISLAGVLPGVKNEAPTGGSFGGAYAWWPLDKSDPTVGGGERALYVGALHAISDSGDSVFFTAGGTAQLYLRHGLTGSKPITTRVSVANSGVNDPNGERPAAFQEATPNGEKVFFLSSGKLTQDANTGPSDEGSDLYRYDAAAKKLVDVAPLPSGAGARVQGLVGIAEDGKSGYLAAQGVLAAGGVDGRNNLYHFEELDGGGFTYAFVAALGLHGHEEWNWSPNGTRSEVTEARTGRVSADGDTLLFMSALPLNGETQGTCIYGNCSDVYRYSVGEGALTCVSCNPSNRGAPRIGAQLTTEFGAFLTPENFPLSGSLSRNLSASGKRIFFQTSESLLPEDVNGQGCTTQEHCVDVYEWEAEDTGSCKVPNVGKGCLYLLSSGESDRSSYFVGASEEGEDAFLITDSPLVPIDGDELGDMYDVRVGGGLASQHATASQPCGSAEACKGASSAPTPAISPGTQLFQVPGNPKPLHCKKRFVRKHGKCVKAGKHHRKKRHHKRNHHKRHPGGAK